MKQVDQQRFPGRLLVLIPTLFFNHSISIFISLHFGVSAQDFIFIKETYSF